MKATLDPVGSFVVRARWALAAMALGLLLAGCQHTPSVPPLEPLTPRMPAHVREVCDPLPAAPGRGSSMGSLFEYADGLIGQYGECALRDRAKADWVKSQGM